MTEKLPRGVWYEQERDRYRIRLYRNNRVPALVYKKTLAEALEIYNAERARVDKIPRKKRGQKVSGPVPTSSFTGLANAVREAAENI